MHWSELIKLQHTCLYSRPPMVVFIHQGSNDLFTVKGCGLEHQVREDLYHSSNKLSNTKVIFSKMFQELERKRKLLNNCIRRFKVFCGSYYVSHLDIATDTPGLYFRDRVHLSDIGYAVMVLSIKEVLERIN